MLKQFFSSGNKIEESKIGANTQIINQLHSLQVEKDILTKTISRLYENDSDLTKIQRDKLLLRYQHQLGVIIARIEKLESVSKHPDLGPLGEGLITLMDQKLSQLDQRLYELTTKIQIAEDQKQKTVIKEQKPTGTSHNPNTSQVKNVKSVFEKPLTDFVQKPNPTSNQEFEITTLTSHSKMDSIKQTKYDQMLSQLESDVIAPAKKIPRLEINHPKTKPDEVKESVIEQPKPIITEQPKPIITEQPKPIVQLPDEPDIDDDDDDLEQIKSNIAKTLSKIEQAEVD